VLILAGAVLVRLWGLGDPAPWMDELHSLLYARNPVAHLIDINRTTDIHPPLYFLALKGWTALFGDSREAALLLSVVLDGVSLLLLFAIAWELFTTRVALIAIVFFATFPTAVHYAREIRMYPLFTALFLASFLCFTHLYLRGRNTQHPPVVKGQALWALGFAISLALTFYTHYTSALLYVLYSLAGLYFCCGVRASCASGSGAAWHWRRCWSCRKWCICCPVRWAIRTRHGWSRRHGACSIV
jgi:uncharacterized membrane protein